MPLNKPSGYRGIDLTYQQKLSLVESLCKGCSHFIFDDSGKDLECGCIYPEDIKDFNSFLRPPYLTVVEIASNTCEFWRDIPPEKDKKVYENEPLPAPKEFWYITDINTFNPEVPFYIDSNNRIWQAPLMLSSKPFILYGKE